MAGHDNNYVATSGLLSALGHPDGPPATSLNLVGDFAGGGLMLAMGIAMALVERDNKKTGSGQGQVIDCAMVSWTIERSDVLVLGSQSQQLRLVL